jgi:molybdopterin-guanine dinucleotide biosynthesis protein A
MNLIILAGGKASRYGSDKAFAEFQGTPIVQIIFEKIGPLFSKVIISTNSPQKYKLFNAKIVSDEKKEIGPLGGIYSGLKGSDAERNFVVGCDMPLIKREVVEYLIGQDDSDAIVPVRNGFPEPLLAVYSRACLPAIKEMIVKKEYKISRLFQRVKTRFIMEEEIKKIDAEMATFTNINTLAAQKEHERKY